MHRFYEGPATITTVDAETVSLQCELWAHQRQVKVGHNESARTQVMNGSFSMRSPATCYRTRPEGDDHDRGGGTGDIIITRCNISSDSANGTLGGPASSLSAEGRVDATG